MHPTTPSLVLLVAAFAVPASARADVLGPVAPIDCPRGAYSTAGGGGHGAFALCAPAIAASDAGCAPGRRREVVGLEIVMRHVPPEWDGRRGPMPEEMEALGTDLVMVNGTCEPAPDAPVFDAGEIARLAGATPTLEGPGTPPIPPGCQRILCWVDDPSETCSAPPSVPPPSSAPSPQGPAATSAPVEPTSSCTCSTHAPRWGTSSMALLALALLAHGARRARR